MYLIDPIEESLFIFWIHSLHSSLSVRINVAFLFSMELCIEHLEIAGWLGVEVSCSSWNAHCAITFWDEASPAICRRSNSSTIACLWPFVKNGCRIVREVPIVIARTIELCLHCRLSLRVIFVLWSFLLHDDSMLEWESLCTVYSSISFTLWYLQDCSIIRLSFILRYSLDCFIGRLSHILWYSQNCSITRLSLWRRERSLSDHYAGVQKMWF